MRTNTTTSSRKKAGLKEEYTQGEVRLKQRAVGTTKLNTAESVIWREWREMEEKAKILINPLHQTREELSSQVLPSPSRRQKPKAIKRHARFFAGLRR